MTTTRKQYSPKFKARVALEAIRGERTLNQLASQHRVHPVQIGHWRKAAIEQMAELFVDGRKRKPRDGEVEKEALFEEIGRLKVELDRSEEHTSELQSLRHLVCRLLLEKKKKTNLKPVLGAGAT